MEFLKEYIDLIIFITLGIMSFLAVWFSIERLIYFSKIKLENFNDLEEAEINLSKNLTALYVIYSNAPYVGLLGTVVGIMITFYDMGVSGGMDARTIMTGLSLALKATALGLLVAIPTLVVYNLLLRKIDLLLSQYKKLKSWLWKRV